ncbi:MAG TPA: hydrogenase expression/formation protein HypE, partial [Clostridia bacterium]|nr:hydrogenase expression/formation protein HypE [Clostridia bacterium]
GLYINTAGVGVVEDDRELGARRLEPGDRIIVSGSIGQHGIAILAARERLELRPEVLSDAAPLNKMLEPLRRVPGVKAMRDPTRGGLATTLNEWALAAGVTIRIQEEQVPIWPQVKGACDLFGFDPLYLANEGKILLAVAPDGVEEALQVLRDHPYGREAALIGTVTAERPGTVILETAVGGERLLDMLAGEQLPRIC